MSRSRLLSFGFRCETRSKLVDQRLHRDAVAVELAVHPHFVGLRQFTEPICQLPVELLRARNQVRVVLEQCDRTMQHLKRLSVSVGSAADSVTRLLRQQLLDRALPVRGIVGVPKCFGAVLAIGAFADQRAAEECEECQCQPLSELFKRFEEAALKGRRKEDRA